MKLNSGLAPFLLLTALPALAMDRGGLLQTSSVLEFQGPSGGVSVRSCSTTTNFFDRHGNLTKTVTLSYLNGDTKPSGASTNSLSYDPHGNLISSMQDFDAGADGIVDSRTLIIYTNFIGNPRHLLVLIDHNADGTIDEIITSTYIYDRDGRLVRLATQTDNNADGVPEFQSVATWTYDLEHHLLFYTNWGDFYSPGDLEVVTYATYQINDDAKPVSGTLVNFDPMIGLEITEEFTLAYDKFGNLTQELNLVELPGPSGPTTSTATTSYFYSHRGWAIRDSQTP